MWKGCKDGLGVDTSLVGESAVNGDNVVEGDLDLDGLSDEVLDFTECLEVVLVHDVLAVSGVHAAMKPPSEGYRFAHRYRERRCQRGWHRPRERVSVGNSATSVVVEVALDVTTDDTTESADEIVNLSWVSDTTVSAIPTR